MLTQKLIEQAVAGKKPYSLTDHDRLYIEVLPTGTKSWRFRYRYNGKRDRLTFGRFPAMSLKAARSKAIDARGLLERGIDPATRFRRWHKRGTYGYGGRTATGSALAFFKDVVAEYYGTRKGLMSDKHIATILRLFNKHLFPALGDKYISDIRPRDLLTPIQHVEHNNSVDMAHRLLNWSGQVFRYAVATQRIEVNPAAPLKGALRPITKSHFPAITDPVKLGKLLADMQGYRGLPSTQIALNLAPHLFLRPGELRKAEWQEFDVDAILACRRSAWEIPGERMKMKQPHVVPLSDYATQMLCEMHHQSGKGRYVFPNSKGLPLSDATLTKALRTLGWPREEVSMHGFRATARTLLDEQLHYRVDLIEHQLAHSVKDPLGRAYNRTKHLEKRGKMMQHWSEYLCKLRR